MPSDVNCKSEKVSYILWSDPKRTTKLMCYYTLARDVRKQTERTVNEQCPYGARRHYKKKKGRLMA
jgi:hypothetical protein